jgi:DNA-binding transcriptional MocR family regulator
MRRFGRRGVVHRRQGSGTWIRPSSRRVPVETAWEASLPTRWSTLVTRPSEGQEPHIEFLGAHNTGSELITRDVLLGSVEQLHDLMVDEYGYFPAGYPPLRHAVARYLESRGVPCTEDEILITAGAQHAISVIVQTFVRRGDPVVIEDPTYPGSIDLLSAAEARVHPVPLGPSGLRLGALWEAIQRSLPRLVYLVPSYHNPTGRLMSQPPRQEIARLAEHLQVIVVEDNSLAEIRIGPKPPPPIAAFAPSAPIVTVGSLSKLFWGGLRVGWIRAPGRLLAPLLRVKGNDDLGSSVPGQVIATALMDEVDRAAEFRHTQVTARMEALSGALREALPSWSWEPPGGGLSLWIRLPFGSAVELAQIAQRHGVAVLPGPATSNQGGWVDHLRLPYIHPPDVLREGVSRLALAWDEYEAMSGRRPNTMRVVV